MRQRDHSIRWVLWRLSLLSLLGITAALSAPEKRERPPATGDPYWVEPMRQVHRRFSGEQGTLAQFGDSITVTQAFWAPLRHAARGASPTMQRDLALVRGYLRPECWQDWKGPEYGSEGMKTVRWADE